MLSAHTYLQMAKTAEGPKKQTLLLSAAKRLVEDRQPKHAQKILNQPPDSQLNPTLTVRKQLLQANVF